MRPKPLMATLHCLPFIAATVFAPVALVAVWRATRPVKVCSALVGSAVEVRPVNDCKQHEKHARAFGQSRRFSRSIQHYSSRTRSRDPAPTPSTRARVVYPPRARAIGGAPDAPNARLGRPRVASGAQKSFGAASDVAKYG